MDISWSKILSVGDGGGRRRLVADVVVWIDGDTYRIPKDFVWDGASIPMMLWPVYGTPFDSRHLAGGLIHDAIYGGTIGEVFTRKEADQIYRQIIRACGVGWWQATKEYFAIRLFGGSHYVTNKGEK